MLRALLFVALAAVPAQALDASAPLRARNGKVDWRTSVTAFAGVDCSGLTDSTTGVQAAFAAAGIGGTVFIPDHCMPAVTLDALAAPHGLTIIGESAQRSGLQATGQVCVGGLYPGAACTASGQCGTGGTCSGSLSAPTAGTQYTLLGVASGSGDGALTLRNLALRGRQVDEYQTCASGPNAGNRCRTVCSTNAAESTTPVRAFGIYAYCNEHSDCSSYGGSSTCIGLSDCMDGGVGVCTGAPGNPAGPGDIRALNAVTGLTLDQVTIQDVRISQTVVDGGASATIRDVATNALSRTAMGTAAGPAAPDVDKGIVVAAGAFVERVTVMGSVRGLQGTGSSPPSIFSAVTVDGTLSPTIGIDCATAGCVVTKSTPTGTTGISVTGQRAKVIDNDVSATTGIGSSGERSIIAGNSVYTCTTGITVTTGNRQTVDDNTVTCTTQGIAISGDRWAASGNAAEATGTNGVAFLAGGIAGTMAANNLTATGSGGTCVTQNTSQQLIVDAATFIGCYYGFVSNPLIGLTNVTISDSRFMGVSAAHTHAEQVVMCGAGPRLTNNYFNLGAPDTERFCNESCTDKGTACTSNGDCDSCSGTSNLPACVGAPLVSLGHATLCGGDDGTAHAELRDNLFFDPDDGAPAVENVAVRFVASNDHNDPIVEGNHCYGVDLCVDAGGITATNTIIGGDFYDNRIDADVATAYRLPGVDTGMTATIRDNRLQDATASAWVNDWADLTDGIVWENNQPTKATDWDIRELTTYECGDTTINRGDAVALGTTANRVVVAPTGNRTPLGVAFADCDGSVGDLVPIVVSGRMPINVGSTTIAAGDRLTISGSTAGQWTPATATENAGAQASQADGATTVMADIGRFGITSISGAGSKFDSFQDASQCSVSSSQGSEWVIATWTTPGTWSAATQAAFATTWTLTDGGSGADTYTLRLYRATTTCPTSCSQATPTGTQIQPSDVQVNNTNAVQRSKTFVWIDGSASASTNYCLTAQKDSAQNYTADYINVSMNQE